LLNVHVRKQEYTPKIKHRIFFPSSGYHRGPCEHQTISPEEGTGNQEAEACGCIGSEQTIHN